MNFILYLSKSNIFLFYLANLIYKYFPINVNSQLFILNYIKKKKVEIVDIGGHLGESSKVFYKLIPSSKVHCFEPILQNYIKIKSSFKNNKNIKVYNYGIGTRGRTKLFVPILYNLSLYSLASETKQNLNKILKNNLQNIKKFKYKCINTSFKKLDDFNLKPDLIKIDVEGSEFNVLKTSLKTIKKYHPILIIEINQNVDKIKNFLIKINYKTYNLDNGTLKKIQLNDFFKDSKTTKNIIALHDFGIKLNENIIKK